jgi:hypothetical protein
VRRVGRLPRVRRSLPRVLDGQRGRDHHDLPQAAPLVRLEHHPAEPRVDRQLRQPAAQRGQQLARLPGVRPQRPQLLQQLDAGRDLAAVGRVEEREGGDLAQAEGGHLQDDRGQAGAHHLRVGEPGAGEEVLLVVQPHAHAVGHPAAPAGALVRRGLRDRLDRQALHLEPVAVPGDPRRPWVDDEPDARNGQRGLGDVGGQHDPPPGVRGEDPVLLGRGQPRVQRKHLDRPGRAWQPQSRERVRGVPDLPLAGQEDQDVAGPDPADLPTASQIASIWSRVGWARRPRPPRPAAGGSGSRPGTCARTPRPRGVAEVPREALRVDGRQVIARRGRRRGSSRLR